MAMCFLVEPVLPERMSVNGKQYPIQSFRRLQPRAYSYGKLHLDLLLNALLQIEEVFFIDPPHQPVIALSSDFRTHPENSFTFDTSALSGDEQTLLEQFLEQNHVNSYRIAATFPHEVVSPDGRLIAQDDGIYLMETNQLIAQAPPSSIRGWTSDGRGAIYSSVGRCLKWRGVLFGDNVWCEIWVPQPVIILNVPEEYLLPAGSP
jgi:hypothetical protein